MGADLCLNTLVWDKNKKLNWKAGYKALEELALSVWKEEHPDREPTEDELDALKIDNEQDIFSYSMIKLALADLEDCFKSGFNRRDINVIEFPPYNILITGGESWGDSPSEFYEVINDVLVPAMTPSLCEVIGFETSLINYKKIVEKILKTENICPLLLGLDSDLDDMIARRLKGKKKCSSRVA